MRRVPARRRPRGRRRSTVMMRCGTAMAARRSRRSTGVVLQRVTERLDGGVVSSKRAFDTVLHSYIGNRDVSWFGCAAWPPEVCRDLLARKDEYFDGAPSASTAPILHAASNREMLRFAAIAP
jgi:hypothetical protein